jgi:RNA polymerase sigma-70 factor (ECF subfamily)
MNDRGMTQELISAARRGDRNAFEALLRPLIDPAYRLALAMLSDRTAAEDAVQESALKAWRAVRRLRPNPDAFRPWLLAIVANQCRDTRRRRWWTVLKLADLRTPIDHTTDAAGIVDLREAVARLPANDRLVLYLFFYLDLPLPEVAATLGISTAAAKARLYRITRRLRPGLEISEVYQ